MQQKPSTHEFGANVHYMNSMTREKNGLSLKFQKVHPLFKKLNKCRGLGQELINGIMLRKFPFIHLILSTVIIDSLRLFLRISDNLINLLILELRRLDAEKDKYLDKRKPALLRNAQGRGHQATQAMKWI